MSPSDYFQQRWNNELDAMQYGSCKTQESSFWGSILGPKGSLGFSDIISGPDSWKYHQPNSEGWYDYEYAAPPEGILLEFEQRGQLISDNWIGYADFSSASYYFKYTPLMWRFTGIGKHQLENR